MELRRNTSPRSIVKYNVVWLRFDCLKIKLSSNVGIPLFRRFPNVVYVHWSVGRQFLCVILTSKGE